MIIFNIIRVQQLINEIYLATKSLVKTKNSVKLKSKKILVLSKKSGLLSNVLLLKLLNIAGMNERQEIIIRKIS
ncbi:hypothetical protein NUACC26_091880 [Scytonema sp. NUACC26]